MCAKIAYGFWKKRSTISSVFSLSCEKKVKETGIRLDKPKREKPKTVHLLLWQKVCMRRHQHQFTVELNISDISKIRPMETLKANIREAIGKIQLHTIDNVLKNWTDGVGYCMAS